MGVVLHVVVEVDLLLAQPRDELLGRDRPDLLLLGGDRVEQVREAGEQRLLAALVVLVLGLELKHLLAERLAEVERLQHAVRVARVAELERGPLESLSVRLKMAFHTHVDEAEEVLVGGEHVRSDVLLQLRGRAALQDKVEHVTSGGQTEQRWAFVQLRVIARLASIFPSRPIASGGICLK